MNDSGNNFEPFDGEIGVLGAGAWGTALAVIAARAGHQVVMWAREEEIVNQINVESRNDAFLPGIDLPKLIRAAGEPEEAARAQLVLAASPAQHTRAVLRQVAPSLSSGAVVVLCAKGVEQRSLALMSEVLVQEAPQTSLAVLSGPGFAKDVAKGLPTAVTVASADPRAGALVVAALGSQTFRPYRSVDLIGAQIGGAVKNVLAVACGVAQGRALGEGARAALITRGFAEMTRLGLALGGDLTTMNGLAGLGDLVLTCVSAQSRNTSFGHALGAVGDGDIGRALSGRRGVVEGAASAPAVTALARRAKVDMPICAAVDDLLAGRVDVDGAIASLLNRPFRDEGV